MLVSLSFPQSGYTPLHLASLCGSAAAISFILKEGAPVDGQDKVRESGHIDKPVRWYCGCISASVRADLI